MSDGPLFRVIGPDGEIIVESGLDIYIAQDGSGHWRDGDEAMGDINPQCSIEFLRDPRPCAEAVQAVVEAATRWAAGRSQCPLCNDQIPLCPACTLVRAIADLLTHDAFDRAKVAVAPIIEREREGEDVGAVMDLRLD